MQHLSVLYTTRVLRWHLDYGGISIDGRWARQRYAYNLGEKQNLVLISAESDRQTRIF